MTNWWSKWQFCSYCVEGAIFRTKDQQQCVELMYRRIKDDANTKHSTNELTILGEWLCDFANFVTTKTIRAYSYTVSGTVMWNQCCSAMIYSHSIPVCFGPVRHILLQFNHLLILWACLRQWIGRWYWLWRLVKRWLLLFVEGGLMLRVLTLVFVKAVV